MKALFPYQYVLMYMQTIFDIVGFNKLMSNQPSYQLFETP